MTTRNSRTRPAPPWGGAVAYKFFLHLGPHPHGHERGVCRAATTTPYVDRRHTRDQVALPVCNLLQADGSVTDYATVQGACNADRVHLGDLGPYLENTTHWLPWLRTVLGLREEYYAADDHSFISGFQGSASQTLFQPKGSLIFGPFEKTELYLSAGRGFHSDDVRGVFGTVGLEGAGGQAGRTPLLAAASGEEVGLRTNIIPKVNAQFAAFQEDFASELAYDARRRPGQRLCAQPAPGS